MGDNYYLHSNICSHCKRSDTPLHIGKSSGGWTFSFRGYRNEYDQPGCPILSYKHWLDYLESAIAGGAEIRDEYDTPHTLDAFKELVESKRNAKHNHTTYCSKHHPDYSRNCWLDDEGNSFTGSEFS